MAILQCEFKDTVKYLLYCRFKQEAVIINHLERVKYGTDLAIDALI